MAYTNAGLRASDSVSSLGSDLGTPPETPLPSDGTHAPPLMTTPAFPGLPGSAQAARAAAASNVDNGPRIVIGIDYGTTYTGVAWVVTNGRDRPDLQNINLVTQWAQNHETLKVPSQISYSMSNPQWGHNIARGSRILRWTKLELEGAKSRKKELEQLAETLDGIVKIDMSTHSVLRGGTAFDIGKGAEEIVTDYLKKVADKTYEAMMSSDQFHGGALPRTPVDLVITHPAGWPVSALNKTYRAVMAAFTTDLFPKLRHVSLVAEPEACAHYTFRAAQRRDTAGKLRRNDCFVVVDAGGGTVDLAAFQVVGVSSDNIGTPGGLQLDQIGMPSGDQIGSTLIDRNFFEVLKLRLGPKDYYKITDHEPGDFGAGGHFIMKENCKTVMDSFEGFKHMFDGSSGLVQGVALPTDIAIMDGGHGEVEAGVCNLTTADFEDLFRQSVEGTLMLIDRQVMQVALKGKTVKSIFLSGGLGSNVYLAKRVKEYADLRDITVERGELQEGISDVSALRNGDEPPGYDTTQTTRTSITGTWSAVAKGAVLKGLGIFSERPAVVSSCPRHYGVKTRRHFTPYDFKLNEREVDPEGVQWATDQLRWFFRKGDLILPGKAMMERYDCQMTLSVTEYQSAARSNKARNVLRDLLFVASSADEAPTRYHQRSHSTEQIITLRCDLSRVPDSHKKKLESKKAGKYFKFYMSLYITVTSIVELRVMSGQAVLAEVTMDL